MTRTDFLREQTLSGANKCRCRPLPKMSTADEACSLTERKALALKLIFDNMPVYIGKNELIVGTRTFFSPNPGNEDGHDIFGYGLRTPVPYINKEETARFGCDQSYLNRTHFTPDFSIILDKGIDGIIREAEQRKEDPALHCVNTEFLSGVIIAYKGLKNLILRYCAEAEDLAASAEGEEKAELLEIARVCKKISAERPDNFREAVQLLWSIVIGIMLGAGMIPLAVFGSAILGVILLVFTNRTTNETPYILVLQCENEVAEQQATALVNQAVKRSIVKSKTVNKAGVELTVEIRIADSATRFINELSAIPGVHNATLVSYNGEYMA